MNKFLTTCIVLLFVVLSVPAQDSKKDKDATIKAQETTIENKNIELAFKDVMAKQVEATAAIEKLSDQYQSQLAVLNKVLTDAMDAARKSQGLPADYQYNVDNHKFEKPVPVKAPDGTPAKPAEKPEVKAPESKQ